MDWYLNKVDPVEGERLCLDHEDTRVGLSQLIDCVEYLLDKRPDLQITIYSGHVIEEQLGSKRDEYLASHTSLWTAEYTSASSPTWPKATWPVWSLWQYTQKASVLGINGDVDGNRWNGDTKSLIAWFSPAGAVMPPSPPEPPPVVAIETVVYRVTVTMPKGTPITVEVEKEDAP